MRSGEEVIPLLLPGSDKGEQAGEGSGSGLRTAAEGGFACDHGWSQSPLGTTSSLRLADGTCFAVDFAHASGADVMLVTTGKADGQTVRVGGRALTFHFPTTEKAPKVRAEGNAAVVGKQRITVEDGHLVLGTQGR